MHPSAPHYASNLSDPQWQQIEKLVPAAKPGGRPLKHARRTIVDAILYVVKTGCQWHLLPKDFPPYKTVFYYFAKWNREGLWRFIHERLRGEARRKAGRRAAPSAAILDSQSVKHADSSTEIGYDAGKKIKGRKRHLLVDTMGFVLALLVTGADVQDRDGAKRLLSQCWFLFGRLQIIWADSGYLGQLVGWVKSLRPFGKLRLEVVARPAGRGFQLVRKRWIVERTFSWLYKSRRLCRDYEHLPKHSEAMIYIAMTHLMLRRITA
jgi:putative transposase